MLLVKKETKTVLIILTSILLLYSLSFFTPQNYAKAAQPYDWATSWYVNTSNPTHLYNMGYELGQRDLNRVGTQKSTAILFLGAQQLVSGN